MDNPPAYEALSYTWADANKDDSLCQRIFIGKGNRALPITSSCYKALRHLRQEIVSVFVWVDSVCINQSDLKERSYQVAMMDDIFSRANTVHAYVGEDEHGDSNEGSKAISLLSSIAETTKSSGREFKDHAPTILGPFFQRPYFSRLWVVQEVLLARTVVLHCADQSTPITWDMVIKAQTHHVQVPWWMNHIGRIGPHVKSELVQVLAATALCQMSDLRDKIFGLLGLVDLEEASILKADYNLMVREVYIGTAAYLIQHKERLDILEISESLTNANRRRTYGIPSWVPMWDLQERPFAAADISQRLGDIQIGIDKDSARIPAMSVPAWTSSQPMWNRSRKLLRKSVPLSACEIKRRDSDSQRYYRAVDAETGCLVTSGYEVTELKLDDFISLFKAWDNLTVDGVHRAEHFRVIRQGVVTLAISGPMSTLRNNPERVLGLGDYLALVRIPGCRTSFICDKHIRDNNATTYKVVYPCMSAIVYSIGKEHMYSKHPEFDRTCILEASYPLGLDIITFLYQWRYLMQPREDGLNTCNSADSFLVEERSKAMRLYVRYSVIVEAESPSVSDDETSAWRLQLEEDPDWVSRRESILIDDFFLEFLGLQDFWDVRTVEELADLDLNKAQEDLSYCNDVLDTFATVDRSEKQPRRRKEKPGKVEAEISSWKAAWGLLFKRFNGLVSKVLKPEAALFPKTVDDIFELPESWLGAYRNKQELVRLLDDRWMRCTRLLSWVIESAQCFEEAKQVLEGRREILGMFGVGRDDERIVIE